MPYMIVSKENEFCVYKEGEDKKPVGDPLGCHPSEKEANDQMRALYASMQNEGKSVKAIGDWELEVLAIPFGDENNKDSDEQFFSSKTNLYLDSFKTPLIPYYHSYGPDGKPLGEPEIIGKPKGYEIRPNGVWWRVVLDKTNEFAQRIWESAKQGLARVSSGSISHLVRIALNGEITHWPLAEISLIDMGENRAPANKFAVALPVMKSVYDQAGVILPVLDPKDEPETDEAGKDKSVESVEGKLNIKNGAVKMEDKDVKSAIDSALTAFEAKQKADADVKAAAEKADKEKVDAAVVAAKAEWEKEAAAGRRLPFNGQAPVQTKFHEIAKYDMYGRESLALAASMLKSKDKPISQNLIKAIAIKTLEEKEPTDNFAGMSLKIAKSGMLNELGLGEKAYKGDEIMHSDLTSYGLEWIENSWASDLWRAVRLGTFVMQNLPQSEIKGASQMIALESTDPTWYTTPEVEDLASGRPAATVTASRVGTAQKNRTAKKVSASTVYSGEFAEDSIVPAAPQIMEQLKLSGAEILEALCIDGDTEATQYLNINDVGATPSAADWFMAMDGFRKLALVTNTANSRAGGSLSTTDFLETFKLMGAGGINAIDVMKSAIIVDAGVYWKALDLAEVKSRDVFVSPTIENGVLTGLFGRKFFASANFHKVSATRKSQTANGYVDRTTITDNVSGSFLTVRWDQWLFGWKRKMTIKSDEWIEADAYQIVATMRCGLVYRDIEAAAITYGLTV